jgi:methyl-accepting chemotaxis protein
VDFFSFKHITFRLKFLIVPLIALVMMANMAFQAKTAINESRNMLETISTNGPSPELLQQVKQMGHEKQQMFFVSTVMAFALTLLFAIIVGWSVSASIRRIADATEKLAHNETEHVELDRLERRDELGSVVSSLKVFLDNILAVQEKLQARSEQEKRVAMNKLADEFSLEIKSLIDKSVQDSLHLSQSSDGMVGFVEETLIKTDAAQNNAEMANNNVQTVAAAAEEMSATVREISLQLQQASQLTLDAVNNAEQADVSTQKLADSASRIGNVVQLITDIAEQVNLLALNATIEAARAGDAGKGFAVVAAEVKNLAAQVANATEEIARQIEDIQNVSHQVVDTIGSIKHSISLINERSGSIASAVEEQSATTNEIAYNMQVAAGGTNAISDNVSDISSSSRQASNTAQEVAGGCQQLSQQLSSLRQTIDRFIRDMRNKA